MTWSQIKRAVEDAGVGDEDEVSVVQCQTHRGNKTLHKIKLGEFLKLSEDFFRERATRGEWMHLLTRRGGAMTWLSQAVTTGARAGIRSTINEARSSSGQTRKKDRASIGATYRRFALRNHLRSRLRQKPGSDRKELRPRFKRILTQAERVFGDR